MGAHNGITRVVDEVISRVRVAIWPMLILLFLDTDEERIAMRRDNLTIVKIIFLHFGAIRNLDAYTRSCQRVICEADGDMDQVAGCWYGRPPESWRRRPWSKRSRRCCNTESASITQCGYAADEANGGGCAIWASMAAAAAAAQR